MSHLLGNTRLYNFFHFCVHGNHFKFVPLLSDVITFIGSVTLPTQRQNPLDFTYPSSQTGSSASAFESTVLEMLRRLIEEMLLSAFRTTPTFFVSIKEIRWDNNLTAISQNFRVKTFFVYRPLFIFWICWWFFSAEVEPVQLRWSFFSGFLWMGWFVACPLQQSSPEEIQKSRCPTWTFLFGGFVHLWSHASFWKVCEDTNAGMHFRHGQCMKNGIFHDSCKISPWMSPCSKTCFFRNCWFLMISCWTLHWRVCVKQSPTQHPNGIASTNSTTSRQMIYICTAQVKKIVALTSSFLFVKVLFLLRPGALKWNCALIPFAVLCPSRQTTHPNGKLLNFRRTEVGRKGKTDEVCLSGEKTKDFLLSCVAKMQNSNKVIILSWEFRLIFWAFDPIIYIMNSNGKWNPFLQMAIHGGLLTVWVVWMKLRTGVTSRFWGNASLQKSQVWPTLCKPCLR